MKKLACIVLAAVLLFLGASLASHLIVINNQDVYLGVGYTASASDIAASTDTAGKSELSLTAMAITVNRAGVILNCEVDAVQAQVSYTNTGVITASADYKTKYELGDSYGMGSNPYASDNDGDGVILEWYKQADAFEKTVEGKHLDEINALIAEGNNELISADCTISVSDFVKAFDEARKNLKLVEASPDNNVAFAIRTTAGTPVDATDAASGYVELQSDIFAATVDAAGKITAAHSDTVTCKVSVDTAGKPALDTEASIQGKRAMGFDYGMSTNPYSQDNNGDGVILEWFEQADVFDAKVVGHDEASLITLVNESYYGNADVQTSGCTINIYSFIATAKKALSAVK